MTEPSQPRPVPGPPRPGPAPAEGSPAAGATADPASPATTDGERTGAPFADLDERPVAEHVAVFEEEHARLERELGTIDRL
jgi:hypothetical protein